MPSPSVREPVVAGTWYPGGRDDLERAVRRYLDAVPPREDPGRVIALVSPHAGYVYSGATAAHAYASLRGSSIRRVVLLGPVHRPIPGRALSEINVPAEAAFRTPLGDVPVDHGFVARLARHAPVNLVRGDAEHSLEIQLPFLQAVLERFHLVPLMLAGDIAEPETAAAMDGLIAGLAALCDPDTVVVASTDLAHLHDYEDVRRTDATLLAMVGAFDCDGLESRLRTGAAQACGAVGLVAAMRAARALGATRAEVLAHTTSGDVTGDKRPGTYTVGYLAAAMAA